jgi:hypothetical protein
MKLFAMEGELTGVTDCNCSTCGMHPFGEGAGPDGSAMAAVNIRCLEGVDVYDIPVHHYNGRAL